MDHFTQNTHSTGQRLGLTALGMGLGALAALSLAGFMYTLISTSEMQLDDSGRVQMLDFVRLKRDEAPERKDRKPERPEVTETPDTPPETDNNADANGDVLAVMAPTAMGDGLGISRSGIGIGTGDGEYLPIVKVAPVYPRRALERGMTGTCMVRYTVTTAGTVRDVSVEEENCSDSVFHRPSVEAAKRFKYKPRVIDGVAIEVQDVRNLFHYELDDAKGGGY